MFEKRTIVSLQCPAAILFLLGMVLSACGPISSPEPPAPALTPSPTDTPVPPPTGTSAPPAVAVTRMPDVSDVEVGQEIALVVETEGQDVQLLWIAIKGTLSPSEGQAVIYTAPDTEGVDIVTLEVRSDDYTNVEHISFNVVARPTDTPTSMPAPAMPDAVVVAHVNLRSGPGTMYDVISVLSPGQVLTVTGRNADTTWLRVNTDQMQEAWIANQTDLVTLHLPPEAIPTVSPPPTPTPSLGQSPTVPTSPIPTSPPRQTPTVSTPSIPTPVPPPPPPISPPVAFTGKVCQIKSGWDTSTIFLRQAEFDALGLPIGAKVTVTVRDTGGTFENVTLGLDEGLETCMVRLPKSYREALRVAEDTDIDLDNRPDRRFDITQTSLPMNKETINFQGKVCQIKSGQDTNTVFLRQPEYNDFGVPAGTTVSVTVHDTGRTIENVTLDLDSGIAECSVRLAKSLREALGVAEDTDIEPPENRPNRQFSIRLLQSP